MTEAITRARAHLDFIYGEEQASQIWPELLGRLETFAVPPPSRSGFTRVLSPDREGGAARSGLGSQHLTQEDAFLITYGDQIQEPGQRPLHTLANFLDRHLGAVLNGVHILPCFPYSSDDGFSVIDYWQVDPALGDWEDVAHLGRRYRLMFDAVINHISQHSAWFQAFKRGEAPYTGYFITVDPQTSLSEVVRPRALPLLTPVETADRGRLHVWTTFSADQIDLNYANPQVLLEIVDVLLHYVRHGAEIIRLDAIAYLWKEIGSSCIHLEKTHAVVKLWRAILDAVAPHVLLITETNVPHSDNISYFGRPLPAAGSTDEAQLVYNFSLAPLTLCAFQSGDARTLSNWAATLKAPVPGATFFNFIASHDGIGVMPARGILSQADIDRLMQQALAHGGQVSYKANSDGSRSVYELNITLYDFLNDPAQPQPEVDVARFLASQVILLSLAGVPGIYVHSLFGTRNCHACYAETGRARSLNRQKFDLAELEAILGDENAHQRRVFEGYRRLLRLRRQHPAFDPASAQRVLILHDALFALARWREETPLTQISQMGGRSKQSEQSAKPVLSAAEGSAVSEGTDVALAIVNVSGQAQRLELALAEHSLPPTPAWRDLIRGKTYAALNGRLDLALQPYQALWLAPEQ